MTKFSFASLVGCGLLFLISCAKKGQEVNISSQEFMAGSFIQNGDTLNSKNGSNGRALKGTLQSGQTYYLSSDFADCTVNSGDTLAVQSGVQVLVVGPTSGTNMIGTEGHAPALVINGTFLCLGTKTNPILFSVADPSLKSNPSLDPQDPNTDPAFKLANLSVVWRDESRGWTGRLTGTYTGRRIYSVSGWYGLDYWQRGYSFVDASLEKQFGRRFRVFVKAANLFNTITTVDLLTPNPEFASGLIPGQERSDRITVMSQVDKTEWYGGWSGG